MASDIAPAHGGQKLVTTISHSLFLWKRLMERVVGGRVTNRGNPVRRAVVEMDTAHVTPPVYGPSKRRAGATSVGTRGDD